MKKIFKNRKGFSLAEMMIVVAIIAVLCTVGTVSIVKYQKKLNQLHYDSNAQIIFEAAQNRIAELYAANGKENFKGMTEGTGSIIQIAKGDTAAALLFPNGTISGELIAKNWKVEFDPSTGIVYAAYYSEKEPVSNLKKDNTGSVDGLRFNGKGTIGYYGNTAAGISYNTMGDNSLKLTIINKDILKANVELSNAGADLYYTVQDEHNHSKSIVHKKIGISDYLVLDSLRQDEGFAEKFPGFIPGDNITVTVYAKYDSVGVEDTPPVTVRTNSLFADYSLEGGKGTAVVRYGRHLQNLHLQYLTNSGVTVDYVLQDKSIDFSDTGSDMWLALYGPGRFFIPIVNDGIDSFVSNNCTITGLKVYTTSGNGGLFDTFKGSRIQGVNLVGAYVYASGDAGAIAGELSGTVTLTDCTSYLLYPDYSGKRANSTQWITSTGEDAGGLFGSSSGSVTITGCSASSVIYSKTASAGGLFGVASSVNLSKSYADCYIAAKTNAGGLGGFSSSAATITNCYAAGFIFTGTTSSHGYVNGAVPTITTSYSIMDYFGEGGGGTLSDKKSFEDLGGASGAFVDKGTAAAYSTAYNIGATGLTLYSEYPMLKKSDYTASNPSYMYHYGDWNGRQAEFITWDNSKSPIAEPASFPESLVLTDGYMTLKSPEIWDGMITDPFYDGEKKYRYEFDGWRDITDASDPDYDKVYMVNADGTLYPKGGDQANVLKVNKPKKLRAEYKMYIEVTYHLVGVDSAGADYSVTDITGKKEYTEEGYTLSQFGDVDISTFTAAGKIDASGNYSMDSGWYSTMACTSADIISGGRITRNTNVYARLYCSVEYYGAYDMDDLSTAVTLTAGTVSVKYGAGFDNAPDDLIPTANVHLDGDLVDTGSDSYDADPSTYRWFTDGEYGLTEVHKNDSVLRSIKVYNQLKCHITLNAVNTQNHTTETLLMPVVVDYGTPYTYLDQPDSEKFSSYPDSGYSLKGWYITDQCTTDVSGKIESDGNVYAQWVQYSITYMVNRPSYEINAENLYERIVVPVTQNNTIQQPNEIEFHKNQADTEVFLLETDKNGKVIWYTDAACKNKASVPNSMSKYNIKSMVVYAHWLGIKLNSAYYDSNTDGQVYGPFNGLYYKKYAPSTDSTQLSGYQTSSSPSKHPEDEYAFSSWCTPDKVEIIDYYGVSTTKLEGYTTQKNISSSSEDEINVVVYAVDGVKDLYAKWAHIGQNYKEDSFSDGTFIITAGNALGNTTCLSMNNTAVTTGSCSITQFEDYNVIMNTTDIPDNNLWVITHSGSSYFIKNKATQKLLAVKANVEWVPFTIFFIPYISDYSGLVPSTVYGTDGGIFNDSYTKSNWNKNGTSVFIPFLLNSSQGYLSFIGEEIPSVEKNGISTGNNPHFFKLISEKDPIYEKPVL